MLKMFRLGPRLPPSSLLHYLVNITIIINGGGGSGSSIRFNDRPIHFLEAWWCAADYTKLDISKSRHLISQGKQTLCTTLIICEIV